MHDFDTAERDGFAVRIPLTPPDLVNGFERIVVVGMKWCTPSQGAQKLESLLNAHHYSTGLGFVPHGSPTNNTNEAKSPYSTKEDRDAEFDVEIDGPANWDTQSKNERRTNGHRLADALGIDPTCLRYIEKSGSVGDSYAKEMNTVLWTVTGDYYLRYLLPGFLSNEQLKGVENHVREFVRGGGPLPNLRIGRQPYGVLPVTRVTDDGDGKNRWEKWDGDSYASDLDLRIHDVISLIFELWQNRLSNSKLVPRIGEPGADPDATLLSILSMEPNSLTYRARPYVDDRFVAWLLVVLRDYAFGPKSAYEDSDLTPVEWVAGWSEAWDSVQERVADLLAKVTGTDAQQFLDNSSAGTGADNDNSLINILGWGEGADAPIEMVQETRPEADSPSEYLAQIYKNSATESLTLLADMCCRALSLAKKQDEDRGDGLADCKNEIREAIKALSSASTLSLFNNAASANELAAYIKADPLRDGYGVRHKLAGQILDRRVELGGEFASLKQIHDVYRVGADTMHAILFSSHDDKRCLDIGRLFSESLDLASHRVDAWVTSFATKRLRGIREKQKSEKSETGIHLGAYGFVEDLKPRVDKNSEGYIHAPSFGQAAAGAVLYNGFLTHDSKGTSKGPGILDKANPFHINLTSDRVRKALRILEGLRQGQPLGALLGYQFERALRDHEQPLEQYIHDLRDKFPLVAHKVTSGKDEPAEAVAAKNVVDGLALIRDYSRENSDQSQVSDFLTSECDHRISLESVLEATTDALDALGDVLLNESVYQTVQGNFERAGAALDAASGNLPPPKIESVKTPVAGQIVQHRVGILFNIELQFGQENEPPSESEPAIDPRGAAEPRIAAWFGSLLGPMYDIGVEFEFWEEETNETILERVNINTASIKELTSLPPITDELAQDIINERSGEQGLFRQINDLARVDGIDDSVATELKSHATTGYVERVNINTALPQELNSISAINDRAGLADAIKAKREIEPFLTINSLLSVEGIDEGLLKTLRPLVTTGQTTIRVSDLKLSIADFLYTAQFPLDGAQTELEQRLARIVRDEFALPITQRVEIYGERSGRCPKSLADAVELARKALDLLAAGVPMTPDKMCHPNDIEVEGYAHADVVNLTQRVKAASERVSDIIQCFENTKVKSSTSDEIVKLLDVASHYGVLGAFSPGGDDPHLIERYETTLAELRRRKKACDRLVPSDDDKKSENSKVKDLVKATKELFGKGFVKLPTFVPHQKTGAGNDLNQALTQDVLNGHGKERLRLWVQQVSAVSDAVTKLEDILMMGEAWSQTGTPFSLNVSQLPYYAERHWLGLSNDERDNQVNQADWVRNPLSLVLSVHGDTPAFATSRIGQARPVTAGILLDEWDELIPSPQVDTSVAYQYDAPNTQAPQSLLLAVSSKMEEPAGAVWTPDALAKIVRDTADLAKVRAVDFDALAKDSMQSAEENLDPVGSIFPGIFLPVDADQPGWARENLFESIEDWLDALRRKTTIVFADEEFEEEMEELVKIVDDCIFRFSSTSDIVKTLKIIGLTEFYLPGDAPSHAYAGGRTGRTIKALHSHRCTIALPETPASIDLLISCHYGYWGQEFDAVIIAFDNEGIKVPVDVTYVMPSGKRYDYSNRFGNTTRFRFDKWRVEGENIRRMEFGYNESLFVLKEVTVTWPDEKVEA